MGMQGSADADLVDIISPDANGHHEKHAHAGRTHLANALDFHFRFAPSPEHKLATPQSMRTFSSLKRQEGRKI
jgi:hypothetical protein